MQACLKEIMICKVNYIKQISVYFSEMNERLILSSY